MIIWWWSRLIHIQIHSIHCKELFFPNSKCCNSARFYNFFKYYSLPYLVCTFVFSLLSASSLRHLNTWLSQTSKSLKLRLALWINLILSFWKKRVPGKSSQAPIKSGNEHWMFWAINAFICHWMKHKMYFRAKCTIRVPLRLRCSPLRTDTPVTD